MHASSHHVLLQYVSPQLGSMTSTTFIFPAQILMCEHVSCGVQHNPVWSARPSLSVDICLDLVSTISGLRNQ